MNHRAEIDGLRALAVLPVILFHAGFEWFGGGFVGVDVFFVISGYLITTIIISEMAERKFSLANFYERRARRILPALFLVMLVCSPFAWFWLTPRDLIDFGQSLAAVSVFSSNILFWLEGGYFATAAEYKPLLHTWSLAIEEQYYILFPLFLIGVWHLDIKWVLSILAIIFIVSLGVAHWGAYHEPFAAFFLLPTRAWELLLGVFVAFYLKHNSHFRSHKINQVLSLFGFGMIVYAIIVFDDATPFPSLYALVPTMGAALLILSAVPKTLVYRLLAFSPIAGIGLISYSAYLWHQPILAFARHRLLSDIPDLILIILCLSSFAMAYISWRWVERPFREKGRFKGKTIFMFAVSGLVLFCSASFAFINLSYSNVTVNPNILSGDIGHDEFHQYVAQRHVSCENEQLRKRAETWAGFLRCQQTKIDSPVKVAIFGDSHAEHLFLGLAESLDENLIYLVKSGNPFVGRKSYDHLIEHINKSQDIETVIYGGYWHRKFSKYGEEIFSQKVSSTIEAFINAGKKVILLGDVPDFIYDADNCYYLRTFARSKCELEISEHNRQRAYLSVFEEIAKKYPVELIDLGKPFCLETACNMILNNSILYRDNDHLNIIGSKLIGKYIVEKSDLLKQ